MKLIKNCEVCGDVLSKYKCPNCLIFYCSLVCYKRHKEEKCEKKEVLGTLPCTDLQRINLDIGEDEQLGQEKLQLLSTSCDLKNLLSNPHLRTMLNALDNTTNKSELIERFMQEPIFIEFADKCLSIVKPS